MTESHIETAAVLSRRDAPVTKNGRGEFIGMRTDLQLERDGHFKEAALRLIEESGENWAIHSLAVMKRNTLARVIYINDVYQKILHVPGVICEFGVQWGSTLATLVNLRALYEPYNQSRMIFGFDTFAGFKDVDVQDGEGVTAGDFRSQEKYEEKLDWILSYHQSISAFPEHKKYDLIKGDASSTIKTWMDDNPHAIISLAIFDMDLYRPTKDVLLAIQPRLVKGSLLVFDELNCKFFPGETTAVAEVLGLRHVRLTRHPLQSYCAIWEVD